MKVGDLVVFDSTNAQVPGALTAIKYFLRIRDRIGKGAGLIVGINGSNCSVVFPGEELIVLNKRYLRCINESR